MEKLKDYVDSGQLQFAKMNNKNQPQKVSYNQVLESTNRQNKFANVYLSLQNLNWHQKYQWVVHRKQEGNEAYRNGNYDEAIEIYINSLIGIDLKDETQGRLKKMKQELKYPITLNIATCFFKKKEFKKAISLCDNILNEDSNYMAAIYKKAFLMIRLGEFSQARKLIKKGLEQAKQCENQKYIKDFTLLYHDLNSSNQQNKKVYQRIFNSQNQDQSANLLPAPSFSSSEKSVWTQFLHYLTDCFKLRHKATASNKIE